MPRLSIGIERGKILEAVRPKTSLRGPPLINLLYLIALVILVAVSARSVSELNPMCKREKQT